MKKRKTSILLFLVVTFLVISLVPSKSAHAALNRYGSPDPHVYIEPYSFNDTYQKPIDAAVNSWNLSSTPVQITKRNFVKNTVRASSYSEPWFGLITSYVNANNETTRFEIKINSRTISKEADRIYWFIKSVAVHEFGHVFYLADNPGVKNSSIMNYDRDRNVLTNPTSSDIRNVNSKY